MRHLTKILWVVFVVSAVWCVEAVVADSADKFGEPGRSVSQTPVGPKVDVNRATVKDLSRLPGMTIQDAERIIQYRPYKKLDDLVTRKVLGKKRFAQIKELIVAGKIRP